MKILHMTTYRRALVALLTALAIGAGIAPHAADVLSVAQAPEVQLASSRGGLSRAGRESAQAPEMHLTSSAEGRAKLARESS